MVVELGNRHGWRYRIRRLEMVQDVLGSTVYSILLRSEVSTRSMWPGRGMGIHRSEAKGVDTVSHCANGAELLPRDRLNARL